MAPIPLFVYLGQALHAFSSCTLGPAMVALAGLAVAGQSALALRLGRNARFASIGNAMGAALMGAAGYYISEQSVFFMTAALTLGARRPGFLGAVRGPGAGAAAGCGAQAQAEAATCKRPAGTQR